MLRAFGTLIVGIFTPVGKIVAMENFADGLDKVSRAQRSLVDVGFAALGSVGLEVTTSTRSSRDAQARLGLPSARQVCLVLVDGMGYEQIVARSGHIPVMRSLGLNDYISTVAPSTTAAALTALGTGELPGRSAMVSYSVYERASKKHFNLINFKGSPIQPEDWQETPTIFELLQDRVAQTAVIQDPKYQGSGLTRAAFRGARGTYVKSLRSRVEAAVDELRRGTRFVYLYWGALDKKGHHYGVDSPTWVAELETLDGAIGQLLRGAPTGTQVIITADHGMVRDTTKIDIAHEPELARDVRAVAGEERGFMLYTDSSEQAEEVAARWRAWLADRGEIAYVYTKAEAIATGSFGPIGARANAALGDVIVYAGANTGFVDSRLLSESALGLLGVHGAFSDAELRIPWIIGEA